MNPHWQRRLLILGSLALMAISVGVLTWAPLAPIRKDVSGNASPMNDATRQATGLAARPEIDLTDSCWTRTLLGPADVAETVPEPEVPTPTQPPSDGQLQLAFTLLGVAIEDGKSHAILADKYETDVCAAGDPIDLTPNGAIVKEIREDSVVVSFRGKEQWLSLSDDELADQ